MAGEHDTSQSDGEQKITPSQWTNHPSYSSANFDNDFAIIKLSTPLTFSFGIKPICLPSSSTNYDSKMATVTGWGTLRSQGEQPNILQKVIY